MIVATAEWLRRWTWNRVGSSKVAAYKALVRPQLECTAPILNLHHQTEINRKEKVQRTAAR